MISISPTVIISLGTSVFVITVLFFYFRNKMKNLEFKLNTMFQLIQEHVSRQKNEEVSLIDVSDGGDSSAESVTTGDDDSEVNLKEEIVVLADEKSIENLPITENNSEPMLSDEEPELNKFSMAALRQMAEEKNLEKYKSLRKNDLIDLLKSSE